MGLKSLFLEDHQLQVILHPWRPSLALSCGPSIVKASIWPLSNPAHFTLSPGRPQPLVRACLIGSDPIAENEYTNLIKEICGVISKAPSLGMIFALCFVAEESRYSSLPVSEEKTTWPPNSDLNEKLAELVAGGLLVT